MTISDKELIELAHQVTELNSKVDALIDIAINLKIGLEQEKNKSKRLETENQLLKQQLTKKPSKQRYYAVVAGDATGIYTSWEEAEKHTKGFKGAYHKTFKTETEAKVFITNKLAELKQSKNVPSWVHELNLLDSNWD